MFIVCLWIWFWVLFVSLTKPTTQKKPSLPPQKYPQPTRPQQNHHQTPENPRWPCLHVNHHILHISSSIQLLKPQRGSADFVSVQISTRTCLELGLESVISPDLVTDLQHMKKRENLGLTCACKSKELKTISAKLHLSVVLFSSGISLTDSDKKGLVF